MILKNNILYSYCIDTWLMNVYLTLSDAPEASL